MKDDSNPVFVDYHFGDKSDGHSDDQSNGCEVQKTIHKSQVPSQSHGRWEIRGEFFEVHLGYENNTKGPLVDTIIQGSKGWSKEKLDHLAKLLEDACHFGAAEPAAAA